ncbi:MAG: hypothetical protein GF329_18605 [Candidatus Lokiarchaeota archaeon]|nr:hypothetical protein [Candidatus Lokiarchaeota archaeon]
MNKKLKKVESYLRIILRLITCVSIGFLANIVLGVLFLFWCTTFFPIISNQYTIFPWIFINLALFLGTFLAGSLSHSLKRSIIVTISISIPIGLVLIFLFGIMVGISNIICLIIGGILYHLIEKL